MELPKWAFKAESSAKTNGAIDLVFSLRPLGRLWLYAQAAVELIRTSKITLVIELQNKRPRVTHSGEVVEPQLEYMLEEEELLEFAKRVPIAKIPHLIAILEDRSLFASTPADRKEA
jgi:hypothetical protein